MNASYLGVNLSGQATLFVTQSYNGQKPADMCFFTGNDFLAYALSGFGNIGVGSNAHCAGSAGRTGIDLANVYYDAQTNSLTMQINGFSPDISVNGVGTTYAYNPITAGSLQATFNNNSVSGSLNFYTCNIESPCQNGQYVGQFSGSFVHG